MNLNVGAIEQSPQAGGSPVLAPASGVVSEALSQEKATRARCIVLAWLSVATMIAYIDRGCISVAEKLIREDLRISESQMGLVMSAFFLTYAFFQLPAATLDRKWGSRWALPFFSTAWSLATAACAAAGGMLILLPARLAMGGAEAGIFPSSTGVIGRWFPASRRAAVSGIFASFMGVGGALGAALSGLLLTVVSWRWMFVIYAVPGLLWAIGFFLWFRETPTEHPGTNQAERDLITGNPGAGSERSASPPFSWRVLKTRAVAGLASQQFFRALGAMFYISWFPTFLRETRGVGVWEAGLLTSMPHWATMAGSLTGGYLSDLVLAKTGRLRPARQGVAVASMLGCTLCIAVAAFVSNAWLAVLVFSLGSFVAALAGPCAYALTIDLGGRDTPQVFSVMNTSGAVGSIVFPAIAPWLVAATGSWNAVLVVFAATHVAAAVCWMAFDADRPLCESTG